MSDNEPSGLALGTIAFAAIMLMIVGVFQAVAGLGAILKDTVYAVGQDYVFKFDATTWGWIHLLLGILLVFAGIALFGGAVWARTIGVIIAGLSAIGNFVFIMSWGANTFWSILIIALDVMIIWALTVHGRDMQA
jgi:hypothetical protein